MKTFSRDVGLTLPDTGLKTSGELVDFMHKASDKLEMSMLFHYKNYITSDLSAMDYIRYYRRTAWKKAEHHLRIYELYGYGGCLDPYG